MARERLGDSAAARDLFRAAAKRLASDRSAADCAVHAADISLNDLVAPSEAKALLDAVSKRDAGDGKSPSASRRHRVWGDYYASQGNTEEARKAYTAAAEAIDDTQENTKVTAWSGAFGRSTEQYLQTGQWDRAMSELQAWQDRFPLEKLDGYWHLKFIRYWMGRKKYDQAVAQTEQLLSLNPASAYADRALWLAAKSEYVRGKKDRAEATLHSLVKDYPGSPLVPEAKAALESLRQGEWEFSEKMP